MADDLATAPWFVVPAHDARALVLAQAMGLRPLPVLDGDGVVQQGPLEGLGRYAARTAARDLLADEGSLVHAVPTDDAVARCRCCGTVVVPRLGRHWFLASGDLETAAADAVRDGAVEFTPAEARDTFLLATASRTHWCLSTEVRGGVPVPAASCLECRSLTVALDAGATCGKCMGTLEREEASLDARFVAAMWPLVVQAWPARAWASGRLGVTAVVPPGDVPAWVVPSVSLGLELTGSSPFQRVIVQTETLGGDEATDPGTDVEDPRLTRLALLTGAGDLGTARAALDAGGSGATTHIEASALVASGLAALDAGAVAQAANLLVAALAGGASAQAGEAKALADPILGT